MPSIAIKTYAATKKAGGVGVAEEAGGEKIPALGLREEELDLGKEPNQHTFALLIPCYQVDRNQSTEQLKGLKINPT